MRTYARESHPKEDLHPGKQDRCRTMACKRGLTWGWEVLQRSRTCGQGLSMPCLSQEYGALMMQSGTLGKGQVMLKAGGVPAGSFSFSVMG